MQEELYVRSEGRSATDPLHAGLPGLQGLGTFGASVENVPSEQLWRAAVLAARQAAATAAELRRAFDETLAPLAPQIEDAALRGELSA